MSLKSWLITKGLEGKLPDWLYRFIGKEVAEKLNLQEDSNMQTKPWYQSRTIWVAVVTALIGAVQPVSAAAGHPITVPNWILEVLTGLGLYGLRTGSTPIA